MAIQIPLNRFYPEAYLRIAAVVLNYNLNYAEVGFSIHGDQAERDKDKSTSVKSFGMNFRLKELDLTGDPRGNIYNLLKASAAGERNSGGLDTALKEAIEQGHDVIEPPDPEPPSEETDPKPGEEEVEPAEDAIRN